MRKLMVVLGFSQKADGCPAVRSNRAHELTYMRRRRGFRRGSAQNSANWMELVLIPTLTDSKADFEVLFGIARRVHGLYEQDIVLDFSNCTSLMQNAVSVI